MTAPTLVGTAFNTGGTNATTSAQVAASGVQAGDLVVIIAMLASDNNLVGTPSVVDSAAASYGTPTLDADHLNGGGRVLVWSVVCGIVPASGTCTVTMGGTWPTTGNRRWAAAVFRPGSTDRWARTSTAGRADRLARKGTGQTDPGSGNPWGIVLDGSNSGRGQLAAAASVGGSALYTTDWNNDNTYSDATTWADLATHALIAYYQLANGTLAPASGAGLQANALNFATGRTATKAVAGVIYEVSPAWTSDARGRAAAKGSGTFGVVRPRESRGRIAAKGTGAGYLFTGTFPGNARGNAAAKGTGQGIVSTHSRGARANSAAKAGGTFKLIKTASGRGRSGAEGFSYQYKISHSVPGRANIAARARGVAPSHARGRIAAKASATFTVTRRAQARANVVGNASSIPVQAFHVASSRGRNAATGTATFTVTHPSGGRANIAAGSSAVGRTSTTGSGNAAAYASGTGIVHHHPTPRTVTLIPAVSSVTLEPAVSSIAFV